MQTAQRIVRGPCRLPKLSNDVPSSGRVRGSFPRPASISGVTLRFRHIIRLSGTVFTWPPSLPQKIAPLGWARRLGCVCRFRRTGSAAFAEGIGHTSEGNEFTRSFGGVLLVLCTSVLAWRLTSPCPDSHLLAGRQLATYVGSPQSHHSLTSCMGSTQGPEWQGMR